MYLDTDFATTIITRNAVASSVRISKMHGSASKHQLVPIASYFPIVVALGIILSRGMDVYVLSYEHTQVYH